MNTQNKEKNIKKEHRCYFMEIYEINPFVRFAQKFVLTESGPQTSAYDHRLFYVEEGNCNIQINDDEHHLQKGSVVLFQSGTAYKFNINKQIKIIAVNFDYTQKFNSIAASINPTETIYFNQNNILEELNFSNGTVLNLPAVIPCMYELNQPLNKIVNELEKNIMYANEVSSAILKEVILKIMRFAVFATTGTYDKTIRIIQYIEENYRKNITNEELSKISGYHPYHLNRLMQKYAKTTTHKYLMNYRIKKAQEFLINTDLNISEISDLCGFKTPYYFSNMFKENLGVSPLKYRKEQKNKI